MWIHLNGIKQNIPKGLTVFDLLNAEGEPANHVIVEIDGVFIPKAQYTSRLLHEGERVEIILPAFGG